MLYFRYLVYWPNIKILNTVKKKSCDEKKLLDTKTFIQIVSPKWFPQRFDFQHFYLLKSTVFFHNSNSKYDWNAFYNLQKWINMCGWVQKDWTCEECSMDVYLIFRIDLIQESVSEWEHIFVELRKLEIAIWCSMQCRAVKFGWY